MNSYRSMIADLNSAFRSRSIRSQSIISSSSVPSQYIYKEIYQDNIGGKVYDANGNLKYI